MSDEGIRAREKAEKQIELRLLKTYTEAQKDILKKLDGFVSQHKAKDKVMRKRRDDGEISEDDYKNWLSRQVFIGAQWEEKVREITNRLTELRGDDLKMIHDREIGVFADNANYQAYKLEHDIGKSFRFDIYDERTVRKLVEEKPALLPKKIVDPKKHNHWNQGIIANCITQGIIQGESIPKIARRIANTTANHNLTASTLYARTAMTCAQNSGRMERLRESKEAGINVKKKWLATLDSRTRDSHRYLDGQTVDVEKPFMSELGKIMFPGDPTANPANVYNCRCTLVYDYPEYEDEPSERIAYDEWEDEEGVHRESFLLNPNETYGDWLEEKKKRQEQRETKRLTSVQEGYFLIEKYDVDSLSIVKLDKNTEKAINKASKRIVKDFPVIDQHLTRIVFGDVGEGNPAQFLSTQDNNKHIGSIIALNKDMWGNIATIKALVEKESETYGHIKTKNPMSVIAHEYGHGIYRSCILRLAGYNGSGSFTAHNMSRFSEMALFVDKEIERIKENTKDSFLSKAGENDLSEYVAEAFSDYYFGQKREVSRKIVNFFKGVFK